MRKYLIILLTLFLSLSFVQADDGEVLLLDMEMGIFPGTSEYLQSAINESRESNVKLIVVRLDTPGGMLKTSQDMVKMIFDSPVPIVFYVGPTGATATSAGVFVTMAAHIAAMAPGTTIGAAHPVMGDGKDLQDDMRTKAENMTVAMVKSISEQRGRNAEWAEKAVKESDSITEHDALKKNVIDLVAKDLDELLLNLKGKKVKIDQKEIVLGDYSKLPRRQFDMSFKQEVINTISNPNVVSMLWLAATTGLSIELYNPGAILPGVVGVICLILALAAYQIIPINLGGVLLLVVGVLLIGAEMFVTSGILGLGGIIAIILGSIYLIDVAQVPGVSVSMPYIASIAGGCGIALFLIIRAVVKAQKQKVTTGEEGLIGTVGVAAENISNSGRVFVNGEYWKAICDEGIIEKSAQVEVIEIIQGMTLKVRKI